MIRLKTLLGHLAQFSGFSRQGELLCTQGLAYLLQNAGACEVFKAHMLDQAGITPAGELFWKAEERLKEGSARPDLRACTTDEMPVVIIEGKLGADLSEGQLRAYARDLRRRDGGGLLVVLVPRYRLDEARATVTATFTSDAGVRWLGNTVGSVVAVVVSWDEMLEMLRSVSSPVFANELAQLEELYHVLAGDIFVPPTDEKKWRERAPQYWILVDRATRRLVPPGQKVMPRRLEREPGEASADEDGTDEGDDQPVVESPSGETPAPFGYKLRYHCRPAPLNRHSCFSVGIRDPFQGTETPIWLRFNRTTALFSQIKARLAETEWSGRSVAHLGHVWLPLELPPDETDTELLVRRLVTQMEEIMKVVYT